MRGISPERPPRLEPSRRNRDTDTRREIERFELLVDELSAAMTRAPAHAVDHEIEMWLGKICAALNLDRSAIYERDAPQAPVRVTHTWKRRGIPPFPPDFDPPRMVAATAAWVMSGNSLVFSKLSEIPRELDDALSFIERYGPKASAILPMWAGTQVIGAASFGKFRTSRQWPPRLLKRLTLAVRLFGSAIERKQAAAEQRATLDQLRISSRRNMMSEMVGSLAHEVNQPLGAILSNLSGLARLLGRNNPEPATALAAVHHAIEDTKRAAAIIRRVRFMFKGHPEHKAPLNIGALASEVINLTASEAALRKIQVRLDVSPTVRRVLGDRIQLQQCLMNLLMNAFDATSEATAGQHAITVKVAADKPGWAAISVRDNGVGIDPSVANRLFEPFVTTKSNGMGLGLLVTRSIVENHGGSISAVSNADCGATFTFTLPLARNTRANGARLPG